jgi:hypothetical protein
LLPPSLREWLPEEHLAWFVLDSVGEMDLAAFYAGYRDDGWGRAAHDPAIDGGAVCTTPTRSAVRSSRAIERRCRDDVAFRVITANHAPDHATIARFRVRHEDAMAELFAGRVSAAAAPGLGARALRRRRARRVARGRDRQRRVAADGWGAAQHQAISAHAGAGGQDHVTD